MCNCTGERVSKILDILKNCRDSVRAAISDVLRVRCVEVTTQKITHIFEKFRCFILELNNCTTPTTETIAKIRFYADMFKLSPSRVSKDITDILSCLASEMTSCTCNGPKSFLEGIIEIDGCNEGCPDTATKIPGYGWIVSHPDTEILKQVYELVNHITDNFYHVYKPITFELVYIINQSKMYTCEINDSMSGLMVIHTPLSVIEDINSQTNTLLNYIGGITPILENQVTIVELIDKVNELKTGMLETIVPIDITVEPVVSGKGRDVIVTTSGEDVFNFKEVVLKNTTKDNIDIVNNNQCEIKKLASVFHFYLRRLERIQRRIFDLHNCLKKYLHARGVILC